MLILHPKMQLVKARSVNEILLIHDLIFDEHVDLIYITYI